eukprot:g14008.t1
MATNKNRDVHAAAAQGNLAEVKAFLKAGGIIDKRDADRWTPLMLAAREGHIEVARQLLRSGAALEARDGDKWTAMHVAAANGHPQCCQLLLDRGGNPRAVDENKRTPLHWATRYGYAAVVELLLKRGADPNFKDAEGKTAADVIGTDLSEDSREIMIALLREHAQKMKNSKQRRLSCPAIPRTAMLTATNASSDGATGASAVAVSFASSAAPPEKNQMLVTLPSLMVASGNVGNNVASNNGEGRSGELGQSVKHNSFSAAAHIRDHPAGTEPSPGGVSATADQSSIPSLSASKSENQPSTPGPNGPTRSKSLAAAVTEDTPDSSSSSSTAHNGSALKKDGESGGGEGGGAEDTSEVAALRKALRAAEERARACEKSLSESEDRRAKEESRATRLEERVAELEKALSGQPAMGTPV